MHYYKAEFTIECEDELKQIARELLADMAGEAGFESFEDTDKGLDGYVQMENLHRQQLDDMLEEFPLENTRISYALACVINEDWNHEWEAAGFAPIDINGKILVFDARKPIPDSEHPIEIGIRARNAFGTGTHDTTQMILSQLLSTEIEGKRILDCGCGTGILGLACSKLGAEEIIAYDIDEFCVKNTDHNAMLNGVNNINVMEGDSSVLSHISGVFDVVMANINRNILLADMDKFKEVMNVGATLILSGFYESDASLLLEKAWELGLSEFSRKVQNDWCCLVLK